MYEMIFCFSNDVIRMRSESKVHLIYLFTNYNLLDSAVKSAMIKMKIMSFHSESDFSNIFIDLQAETDI